MKKSISLYIIPLLAVIISFAGCASPQLRGTIIPEVRGTNPKIAIVSKHAFGDAIGTELLAHGFRIVERSKLDSVLDEKALIESGVVEDAQLIRAGKILNIDSLVFVSGNYDTYNPGTIASAVVRIIEVQSGKLIGSFNYSNGVGGAPGSPADAVMKESLVESANRIANAIAKGFGK